MQGLQHSTAEAQAQLATANGKAASAGKALCQAQQELHQLHDAYRQDSLLVPCYLVQMTQSQHLVYLGHMT